MGTLLQLKNISKSYFGVKVLRDIDLSLEEGEVLCLVGENGAGKSTLIKIITGAIRPDDGQIILDGQSFPFLSPMEAIEKGIACIYQDVNLVDNITVADNIFLGGELLKKSGTIDFPKEQAEADELLKRLNIGGISSRAMLGDLSTAQKQCVQIAKALKNNARILIMDEPTASLGEEETRSLLALVKDLAEKGIGIIYISHYLDEVLEIGDRLLILKDGRQVSLARRGELTKEEVIHRMIGRDVSVFFEREHFPPGKGVLSVEHYDNGKTVHDVSFSVRQGEIFGLGGLVGAGRTELVRMIYGCDPKDRGRLLLDQKEITPKNPKDAIQKGIFMISEDRKEEGIFSLRSVKENIVMSDMEKRPFINLKKEKKTVEESIAQFQIKVNDPDDAVTSLSGGNQQKTIIARCVLDEGTIYIFDEPTKGVDVGAKAEIYHHIVSLAKEGKYILLVSSDMPELLSMTDRIGVMREGRLTTVRKTEEFTEDTLLKEYLGFREEEKDLKEGGAS